MNRKYLIRKLNKKKILKPKNRGPKPTYSPELYLPILKSIWLTGDQLCSKKLVVILNEWLPFYEAEQGNLDPEIKAKILKMSASTVDRLLKPIKVSYGGRGLSGTKPGSLIRNQTPILTNQWEENRPGFIEADTVAIVEIHYLVILCGP